MDGERLDSDIEAIRRHTADMPSCAAHRFAYGLPLDKDAGGVPGLAVMAITLGIRRQGLSQLSREALLPKRPS
jgi:hypothetical protein